MAHLPVVVGRDDRTGKAFRFSTVRDAESAIALLETVIPASVRAGDYYIDAPEQMVNPPAAAKTKLNTIEDVIVNRYSEDDEPFTVDELKAILDAIVEVVETPGV